LLLESLYFCSRTKSFVLFLFGALVNSLFPGGAHSVNDRCASRRDDLHIRSRPPARRPIGNRLMPNGKKRAQFTSCEQFGLCGLVLEKKHNIM
jgi:hypothetical protein